MFRRAPTKKMPEMVLEEKVNSHEGLDNWTGETALKRVENEFGFFNALSEFLVDITEEEGRKAKMSRVAVAMFAYMIKQKIDNDTFIASKLYFFVTACIYNMIGSFL